MGEDYGKIFLDLAIVEISFFFKKRSLSSMVLKKYVKQI